MNREKKKRKEGAAMRKVLPILLAIALAMPALADVAVTVDDAGDGVAQLNLAISGDAVVRGLALKVTITGAELAAIADVTDVMPAFNAYIDYYYSNTGFLGTLGDETDLPGTGAHALADPDAAGVLAALPATTFSISLGALDNSGSQGGVTAGGVLAKIKLSNISGSAQVCVEADALRGGIVGDNLGTVSDSACGNIAPGGPACWNYPCFVNGDSNGDCAITFGDLQPLIGAWPPAPYNECVDFNQDGAITFGDLQILINHWPPAHGCDAGCVPTGS